MLTGYQNAFVQSACTSSEIWTLQGDLSNCPNSVRSSLTHNTSRGIVPNVILFNKVNLKDSIMCLRPGGNQGIMQRCTFAWWVGMGYWPGLSGKWIKNAHDLFPLKTSCQQASNLGQDLIYVWFVSSLFDTSKDILPPHAMQVPPRNLLCYHSTKNQT